MTKFVIALCIILTASKGHTESTESSSTSLAKTETSWWEIIRNPAKIIRDSLNAELDSLLAVKRSNDEISNDTSKLCDSLKRVVQDLHAKLVKEEKELKLDDIAVLVPPEKSATCKQIFLDWKEKGGDLHKRYSKCYDDGESAIGKYEMTFRDAKTIFPKIEEYRDQLGSCENVTGLLAYPRTFLCTIWVYIEWILYAPPMCPNMECYKEAMKNLIKFNNSTKSHDECNVESVEISNFHSDGDTVVKRAHACIMKAWSDSMALKDHSPSD